MLGDQGAAGLYCPLELSSVLAATFEQADQDLAGWLDQHAGGEEKNSGCTATTLLVGEGRVITANVGDSRAVLCRGGSAVDLTAEHRVFGRGNAVLSETERIEAVGGWVHDGRVCGMLAVSRCGMLLMPPEDEGRTSCQLGRGLACPSPACGVLSPHRVWNVQGFWRQRIQETLDLPAARHRGWVLG